MPVFLAVKKEYQEMVHACKNQELLARLRKSLPPIRVWLAQCMV